MSKDKRSPQASKKARPVKLGISACLLGEKVRYDGGHKLDDLLIETLGPLIEWLPVCPEVEAGLGVPREPMHLTVIAGGPPLAGTARSPRQVGAETEARLVTLQTRIDQTDRVLSWARQRLPELARENLSGFIFKSRSPSCGLRVEIFGEPEQDLTGPGIWAGAYMAANPLMPVADELYLRDAAIRVEFISRILSSPT